MVVILFVIYNMLCFHKGKAVFIKQAMLGSQNAPVAEDDHVDEDEIELVRD